jgi:glycosyltransferase involved in cell wall biosynthesis
VRNPIDSTLVPRPPKPPRGERLDLAFVGRVDWDKGLAPFLALMSGPAGDAIASLTVYGDGSERGELERQYAALVVGAAAFAGRVDHATLFAALLLHDALILPSIWAENAPLVIVEAAMLGLPALVHDIGSLSTFGDEIATRFSTATRPTASRSPNCARISLSPIVATTGRLTRSSATPRRCVRCSARRARTARGAP